MITNMITGKYDRFYDYYSKEYGDGNKLYDTQQEHTKNANLRGNVKRSNEEEQH